MLLIGYEPKILYVWWMFYIVLELIVIRARIVLGSSVELAVHQPNHGRKIYLTGGEFVQPDDGRKSLPHCPIYRHFSMEAKYATRSQLLMVNISACIKCK